MMHLTIRMVAAAWLACGSAQAAGTEADCLGVDFDPEKPVTASIVLPGSPQVHYVKSRWENADCPSDADACRSNAYLVPRDLVLAGRTRGSLTCIAYLSPKDPKGRWTNGWIPTSRLRTVPRHPSPGLTGWIGRWKAASNHINIGPAVQGMLRIDGTAVLQAAQDTHTGVLEAKVRPGRDLVVFADDGSVPFRSEKAECRVRMQRVDAYLLVEDNGACGGSAVTFTGLYRR
jgi:hypothetical protein